MYIYFLPPTRPVPLLKVLQIVLGGAVPNALLEIKFIFLTHSTCLGNCPKSPHPSLNLSVSFLTYAAHKKEIKFNLNGASPSVGSEGTVIGVQMLFALCDRKPNPKWLT